MEEEKIEELKSIYYEPGTCEILGIFDNHIHVKSYDEEVILIIPVEEHLRMFNIWLQEKQKYCENYGHYCGVLGYTCASTYEEDGIIKLNEYSETQGDIVVDYPSYIVTKFEDVCDFEHG